MPSLFSLYLERKAGHDNEQLQVDPWRRSALALGGVCRQCLAPRKQSRPTLIVKQSFQAVLQHVV